MIIIAALVGSTIASAENIAVLRLESFDAVLADARRVVDAVKDEGSAEELMQPLLKLLQFPGADLLDRSAPLVLVFPMEGIALGEKGLIAVVPLSDPDGAAGKFQETGEGVEPDETGVLYFQDGEGTEVAAKIHGRFLVVGQNRDLVGGFDPAVAVVEGDLPPGNIALDINLEPLTPLILMGLESGRQVLQQQMLENSTESDMDPEMMNEMLGLYFSFIQDAVNNTSRIQFSLEVNEHHVLMHNRWLPRTGSTLEGLLQAQSGDLPDLARYIKPGTGSGSMAGQFTMTPAFQEAMTGYMEGYVDFIASLLPMLEEQTESEPLAALMAGLAGMMEKWTDCYRGDFAGTFNLGGEDGFQVVQVAGIKDAAVCRTVMDEMTEILAQAGEADEEPFISVDRAALKYKRVLADRHVTRMPFPAGAGEDGIVTFYGFSGNHMLSVTGANAETNFKDLVKRVTAKAKKQAKMTGLTADMFAPIETGPGFFIMVDMPALFRGILSAFPEGDEDAAEILSILEQIPDGTGRIVEGIRLDPDAVHLSIATRLDFLKEIGRLTDMEEEAEEDEDTHEHGEAE
jgi:hypothetical protein